MNHHQSIRRLACLPVIVILALASCDSKGTSSANKSQNGDQPNVTSNINTDALEQLTPRGNSNNSPTENTDRSVDRNGNDADQTGNSNSSLQPADSNDGKSITTANNGDAANANQSTDDMDDSPFADIPPPQEYEPAPEYVEHQTIDTDAQGWTRVIKDREMWINTSDKSNKTVIVGGYVCLRRGGLEMFICPMGTKEHESVIAVNALSSEIHAAFLAFGSNPGSPVEWHPVYKAAHGPKVKIKVMWKDGDTIVTKDAKQMVRDFKTKKPLAVDWVFGGSRIYKDPEGGYTVYYGDGGELVCLSNFSTATMDLPISSPDANDDLMYEAYTENIPKPGTKVYVLMTPEFNANIASDDPPKPRIKPVVPATQPDDK